MRVGTTCSMQAERSYPGAATVAGSVQLEGIKGRLETFPYFLSSLILSVFAFLLFLLRFLFFPAKVM